MCAPSVCHAHSTGALGVRPILQALCLARATHCVACVAAVVCVFAWIQDFAVDLCLSAKAPATLQGYVLRRVPAVVSSSRDAAAASATAAPPDAPDTDLDAAAAAAATAAAARRRLSVAPTTPGVPSAGWTALTLSERRVVSSVVNCMLHWMWMRVVA